MPRLWFRPHNMETRRKRQLVFLYNSLLGPVLGSNSMAILAITKIVLSRRRQQTDQIKSDQTMPLLEQTQPPIPPPEALKSFPIDLSRRFTRTLILVLRSNKMMLKNIT